MLRFVPRLLCVAQTGSGSSVAATPGVATSSAGVHRANRKLNSGTILSWDSTRGFGFVKDKGDSAVYHVRYFAVKIGGASKKSVAPGTDVSFELMNADDNGGVKKRVIEVCAPGGGLLPGSARATDEPQFVHRDFNPHKSYLRFNNGYDEKNHRYPPTRDTHVAAEGNGPEKKSKRELADILPTDHSLDM